MYGNTEWVSVLIHGQSFMLHQVSSLVIVELYELYSSSIDCGCYTGDISQFSFILVVSIFSVK